MPSRFADVLDGFFYRPDEEVPGLFEIAATPEEMPQPVPEDPPAEYLAFVLEGETYAVPIGDVREIVKVPPLTEIPRSAANLLGVMNLRGDVVPVHDIKARLHLRDKPPKISGPPSEVEPLPRSARILIVHEPEGDVGVLVDSVLEVVKMRPSTLEQPPRGVTGERDCLTGIGRRRDQLYIIVDIHQALS